MSYLTTREVILIGAKLSQATRRKIKDYRNNDIY